MKLTPFLAGLTCVLGGSLSAQTLSNYQAVVAGQSPAYYFKLDNSLTDSISGSLTLDVAGTGGAFIADHFNNADFARSFSLTGDALSTATDLISGGGPVGGNSSATNNGTITLLFRALDSSNTTGQRFVFSQGNTTGNANALGLFFENNTSSDPGSLKLRAGDRTTSILPPDQIEPNQWYYFAVTFDEARDTGEINWRLGRLGTTNLLSGVINIANVAVVGDDGAFILGNRDNFNNAFRNPGNGRIDEFAVWHRELNPAEIGAQFSATLVTAELELWTDYKLNPDAHEHLPNCSYAGYRYGESPPPDPAVNLINVKDPPFTAVGDGVADDTAAVRAAINSVGTNGGVIYFPDGTYNLSGVLFVHKNSTILRGQSRTNTILRFTRSLQTGYAHNTSGGSSRWSWTGGMIMVCPQSKNTYLPGTNDIGGSWSDGWTLGPQLTTITSAPDRGDKTFAVANASGLSAGQFIMIRVDNATNLSTLKHLCGDGDWAENYDWSPANSGGVLPPGRSVVDWPVEIDAVNGNTITLKQPLRFDLRAAWNPRIRSLANIIRECGIENLTIRLMRDYTWTTSSHNKEPGWNGPWFNNAIHCFVRGVTVIDPDNGFLVSAAKNITFTDIRIDYSAANRRAFHHGTVCRATSHDCLWENFVIAAEPRHGIHVESFSAGNVWSKGTMDYGTFDSHKALPYENIRTEIVINNSGAAGGSADAGPRMGARFVHWNVLSTTNRNHMIGEANILPTGAIVGVRGCSINSPVDPAYGDSLCVIDLSEPQGEIPDPANLYEAQKNLRLGLTVPPVIGGILHSNGVVMLQVSGSSNQVYWIQAVETLTSIPLWVTIGTNQADASGLFQFSDTNAAGFAQRFYRAVRP